MTLTLGIGGHQSAASRTDEWLTPPELLAKLGRFDLDPCAPIERPWPTADRHYTIADEGLNREWTGRVWLNPPYGQHTFLWLHKLARHANGIALTFARTETAGFFGTAWNGADAMLFLRGRLHFHRIDGSRSIINAGAPSVLLAYGSANVDALRDSGIPGAFVPEWSLLPPPPLSPENPRREPGHDDSLR